MGSIDKMVSVAVGIADDDSHGYSQYRRWPSQGTDFDCSSLMYYSAHEAGYDVPLSGYTGTMVEDFAHAGFAIIPFSGVGLANLRKGDVLVNVVHHTEMCIGGGQFVGAHGSETGGIDGAPGDQTGNEISVCAAYIYWDGWDYVLRPPSDSPIESEDEMTECIFYCDSDESGYKKGDVIYWSPVAGFCYLEHPDCITLIKACNPNIHERHTSNKFPWLTRAKQATNPQVCAQTFGKRN